MRNNILPTVSLAVVLVCVSVSTTSAGTDPCAGVPSQLDCAEDLLIQGRFHLENFRALVPPSFDLDDLLAMYPADRDLLMHAADAFRLAKQIVGQQEQATVGLTEALTWLLKGQALLGNEHLVESFSLRYPFDDAEPTPPIDMEIAELEAAVVEFDLGTTYFKDLLESPACYNFSNFRELSRVLFRKALSRNSKADRRFAQGVSSTTRRREASDELRRSSQESYLGAAVLGALQEEADIRPSGVHRLRANALRAVNTFDKIASGADPAGFHGDFVPFLPFHDCNSARSLRDIADAASGSNGDINGALFWDGEARRLDREVDRNDTALTANLASIRQGVKAELDELSGFLTEVHFPEAANLDDPVVIQAFLDAAAMGTGRLSQIREENAAAIASLEAAYLGLTNIPRRIEIEQERVGQIAQVQIVTGQQLAAHDIARGFANAFSYSTGLTFGLPSTTALDWLKIL